MTPETIRFIKQFEQGDRYITQNGIAFIREDIFLKALEGYHKSEWVSVEDRLPDNDSCENILFYTRLGVIMYGFYTQNNWYETYMGLFASDDSYQVTHWQPLPSPPKQ